MTREELIAELKNELKEISDDYRQEIYILGKLKPDTVYRTSIYGESLVKVLEWRRKLRVKVLANKGHGTSTIINLSNTKGTLTVTFWALKGAVEVPPSDFPLYISWSYISPEFESMLKKGARQ
jgi:hypothetical protein